MDLIKGYAHFFRAVHGQTIGNRDCYASLLSMVRPALQKYAMALCSLSLPTTLTTEPMVYTVLYMFFRQLPFTSQ